MFIGLIKEIIMAKSKESKGSKKGSKKGGRKGGKKGK
jgi:hypothetical protein